MLALLWQDALGHSAMAAGLLVAPFAVASVVSAMASRRLTARIGSRVVTVGLGLITAGLAAVGLLVATLRAEQVTFAVMLVPLLALGTGVGLFVGPNTNASFAQTRGADAGVASALVTAAQRCGTAVGIGLLSAVLVTAPGGPTALGTQAVAAFTAAGFAAAGALVMVVSGRHRLDAVAH